MERKGKIMLLLIAIGVFFLGTMNFIPNEKIKMMFLLVGTGAILSAVINILEKHYLKDYKVSPDVMVVATMLGISVFTLPFQFLFGEFSEISAEFWWPFILTVFLNLGIIYWGTVALKLEDASVVSALSGITPMFVILTSWIILKEFPTFYGLIGILTIVLGTYIINLKGAENNNFSSKWSHRFLQPWWRMFHSKGARLALFTAFLGSIALNYDKLAVVN